MNTNEQIIKKIHPDPLYFLDFYFSGIVFILVSYFFSWVLVTLGFFILALAEITRRAETFYISNSGVSREYKLLSTSKEFCEYNKIQNLEVSQSFLNNIFGIGNIHIDTAGSDKTEVNFHGIKYPYEIEKIIREKMKNLGTTPNP